LLMKNKMLNKIMVELILLATIVGYIPDLSVSGFADMFGRVVSTTKHATKFKFKDL